jgi:hypothetical protein
VGVPKLGLLLSQIFWRLYLPQIELFWSMQGWYLIALKKIFPMMYFTPQSKIIWPLLLGDLWSGIKISIWLNLSFDHNSCISGLNEGTLNIYRFENFPMVSWAPNLVFACIFNQDFKYSGFLHECNSQNESALRSHWV